MFSLLFLFGIITFFISYYFFKIYYNFYYNDNNLILGIDKLMDDWEFNFTTIAFHFQDDIPEIQSIFKKFINFELNKSESKYRADLLTSIKLGFLFKGEFFSECLNTCLAPEIAAPAKVRIGPDDRLLILIFFFPKSTDK